MSYILLEERIKKLGLNRVINPYTGKTIQEIRRNFQINIK